MTPEKKIELLKNLNKSFIPMQSGSSRYGYQKTPVIDEALLQEVLEEIINAMIVDTISIAPEELIIQTVIKNITEDSGQIRKAMIELIGANID